MDRAQYPDLIEDVQDERSDDNGMPKIGNRRRP